MIDIQRLIDIATDEIKHSLPENYEIDDIDWQDDALTIRVFDVSTIESSMKAVDSFRFQYRSSECAQDNADRFWDELDTFCEYWGEQR